jgi:hypothetical protein
LALLHHLSDFDVGSHKYIQKSVPVALASFHGAIDDVLEPSFLGRGA